MKTNMSVRPTTHLFALLAVFLSSSVLAGCSAIGDIFKAGFGVGVVVVVLLVGLIAGGAALFRK